MRKIFVISALILLLSPTYGFAQMGKGMTEGQQGGMMEYAQMMNDMMDKLSGMMKDMSPNKMKDASKLMGDR